ARERGKQAVFLPATEQFARTMRAERWTCLKIGASPYFDLEHWNPRGNVARHLRWSINRAIRAGITVEQSAEVATLKAQLESLCENWLATRPAGTSFGWLFALQPTRNARYKRYFLARDGDGVICGFLAASPMPQRQGWYLEDVVRAPHSPEGVCDLLVYRAL